MGPSAGMPCVTAIGVITNIKKLTGSTSSLVEVTPNASLKKLNFVAVVLYVPNNDAVGK